MAIEREATKNSVLAYHVEPKPETLNDLLAEEERMAKSHTHEVKITSMGTPIFPPKTEELTHKLDTSHPHSQGTDPRKGPTIAGKPKKRALILGVNGQDGSFLAEILLDKGYEVHGMVRHSSRDNLQNIEGIKNKLILHKGDLSDIQSISTVMEESRPDEMYNEADQDNVGWSKETPAHNFDITGSAVGRILQEIVDRGAGIKFFQPLSSTMFGDTETAPQNEATDFHPNSPYACAKCFAYHLCQYYGKKYGMFAATAIFYNHDSDRRNEQYLLPKICYSAVRIQKGIQKKLSLGNLKTIVDIGYAKDYMEAAYNIMQLPNGDNFIIGSSASCNIEHIVSTAFLFAGLGNDWKKYIVVDNAFYDPFPPVLVGSIEKAHKAFGYTPVTKVEEIISSIIDKAKEKYS